MEDLIDLPMGRLSKGTLQKVAVVQALLKPRDPLILDEPLSGLDPVQQEETLATIRGLGGQHTVLFSSHQLSDVEKICDRVIIIHRGRIGFDDHLSTFAHRAVTVTVEVKANPAEAAKVMAAVPGVDGATAEPASDGWAAVSVQSRHDKDVREAVSRKAFEKGWGVRRLELKRERLEDTFMKVAYQRG